MLASIEPILEKSDNYLEIKHECLRSRAYTVGPRLLRRLGHVIFDAIFGVDAIFEGRTI